MLILHHSEISIHFRPDEGPGWEKLDALLANVSTQDWRERGAR